MIAEAALNQTVGTLLRTHDEAFRHSWAEFQKRFSLRPNEDGVVWGWGIFKRNSGEISSGGLRTCRLNGIDTGPLTASRAIHYDFSDLVWTVTFSVVHPHRP